MGQTGCGGLRGSHNQKFRLLTNRHNLDEFQVRKAVVEITEDGIYTIRGFPTPQLEGVVECGSSRARDAGSLRDG